MQRIIDRIHSFMSVTSALIITGVIVLVAFDVLMRYFANSSARGALEYSEVGIVIAVYLALGVAQFRRQHIAITLLTDKLPQGLQVSLRRVALAVSAAFLSWVAWASLQTALASVQTQEARFGVVEVAVWPARIVIVIGLAWWVVELVRQIFEADEKPLSAPLLVGVESQKVKEKAR